MNALRFAQKTGAKQRIQLLFKIRISSQSRQTSTIEQSAMHTARLAHWINDGLGERECGHQQHERRGVGSEASLMAAWMLIRSCIFCIGHKVEIVSRQPMSFQET